MTSEAAVTPTPVSGSRQGLLAWAMMVTLLASGSAVRSAPDLQAGSDGAVPEDIARLVEQLGADDYAVRETAAARLAALGPAAADALLTAAENGGDLEVALRARWIVDAIPLVLPHDPPEASAELARLTEADATTRRRILERLLRLDADAGIEPLGRIVRLERAAEGSRLAAALLAGEWSADDPYWPLLAPRISAGVGTSGRPAARFLRALVAFHTARGAPRDKRDPDIDRALAEARSAFTALARATDASAAALGEMQVFRRTLMAMLVAADRRAPALELAREAFTECREPAELEDDLTAAELVWAVEHGLPEAVDLLEDRWPALAIDRPATAYAAALACRARGDAARGEALADAAFALPAGTANERPERLQAALRLARWGADDWALREYEQVLGDPAALAPELGLAGILASEFLHDRDQDDRAAAVLERILERVDEQALQRLPREPQSLRSRQLYFKACAATARRDRGEARRLLEESVRAYPRDVDSLIALHRLPDATPAQAATVAEWIAAALEKIEAEIEAVPDDANGYNEYAWLAANTSGDAARALGYSKRSLEKSFDNASYLDTLAHCRAAAGDFAGAVRTQTRALRQEPHTLTIRRNLERFQSLEARRR